MTRALVASSIALLWAGFVPGAWGQSTVDRDTSETREVELIHVGFLERSEERGVAVVRLNDVRLRQDDTFLEANRAIQYVDARTYRFEGDVLIIDEGDTLNADHVFYDSRTKRGDARGRVRLTDGDYVVLAPEGSYFVDEKRAIFERGVQLFDSAATLRSIRGVYWSDEKRGAFAGDVRLFEGPTVLAADSLVVHREERQSFAWGDVLVRRYGRTDDDLAEIDSTVVTYLLGDEAFNDDITEVSRVAGSPVLMQLREEAERVDTTVVRALEITVVRTDSLDRMVARDSVRIWQSAFAATGDSLSYDRVLRPDSTRTEVLTLTGAPLAWFEQTQVSGDTLLFASGSASTDTLHVLGNAFVVQEDTSISRHHQMAGRRLVAQFRDDSLRTMHLSPNARVIRYMVDEGGSVSWGVRVTSDAVTVDFLDDGAMDVRFGTDPEGTAYPPELIPEPFRLDGFRWNPEFRPAIQELIDLQTLANRIASLQPPVAERALSERPTDHSTQ